MAIYRVHVVRHYIDVCFFDVETDKPGKAKTLAREAANKLRPDSRAVATDNGWIPEEPVTLGRLGYASTPFETKLYLENKQGKVYIDAREEK